MQPGCFPTRRCPRPHARPSGRRHLRLAAVAATLASLAACQLSGDDVPVRVISPEPASSEPPSRAAPRTTPTNLRPSPDGSVETLDERVRRLFAEARVLVERESGTDLSSIGLRLTDDDTILAEVDRETRRLVYGRLGDVPLAATLLEALLAGQGGTYAALYSGRERAVMVSRAVLGAYLGSLPPDRSRRDRALLVLMLHELVHAADDVRHRIHDGRALDFRASFAQSAALEGHAQWLTRTICRRHGCLDGLDALDAFMFGPDEDAPIASARRALPLERNLLEYSYVEGERFVAALAARPNGPALLERLLSSPPHDPLQILDPESFPDEARERRNLALLAAARRVVHPWLAAAGERPATGGADEMLPRVRPRIALETSPLKGVNLRADPARREAAVDGFTRLVTAMVAVQLHDPEASELSPVEVTLLETDGPLTARLFAETLHAHALAPDTRAGTDTAAGGEPRLLRTSAPAPGGGRWRTAIASHGRFVVQASGRDASPALMGDYVIGLLETLVAGPART